MWSSILAFAIVFVMIYLVKSIPVMAVLVFLSLGLGANAYIMVIKYGNIGRGDVSNNNALKFDRLRLFLEKIKKLNIKK